MRNVRLPCATSSNAGSGACRPISEAVIVLHHYLGLSVVEAAETLGIPLGTVQSRLNRATQAMRAALEADDRPSALAGEVAR